MKRNVKPNKTKEDKTMVPVRRNQNWLPSIFNDFLGNDWLAERHNTTAPAVNIIEDENEYKVEVAAPGMTKEDFKVHINEDNELIVTMEKKAEQKEEDKKKGTYLRREFSYTKFQQSLLLPDNVVREKIAAKVENGVMTIEIPKKNGKSELAAAVALLLTCGDGEERAEVYGCAADRQQAAIVFDVAADMVRMCPALSKRVKILTSQKRIVYIPTNSFYQVLSAEAYSKHGFNIHGVVFDELHTQPNRKLFDVMTKGSGDARMQPLYFLITTAGTDTNSICYEVHQKAKDILEGRKHDPTFYPVIYGADESEDWTDPKVWKKANPSLDKTIGMDKVVAACNSAKETPGEENAFRQLRLNQWVKQAVRWMPMEKWDKCKVAFDEEMLAGRICYGGLDLSSTTDITAFVLVFPPTDDDEHYYILPYFWLPEETLPLRVRRDHVPYDVWEQQGYLKTTEGNVVHYGFIENFIDELGQKFHIKEIAFDRWGAVQMSQNLEGLGFTMVQFGQGYKDTSPTLDINASTCSLFGGSAISSVIFKMITAFSG